MEREGKIAILTCFMLIIFCLLFLLLLYPSVLYAKINRVDVYYSPTCSHCREIMEQFLPQMQDRYPNLFEVNYIDTTIPENRVRLMEFEKAFGFQYQPPTLIIGGVILVGEGRIKAQFETTLQNLGVFQAPALGGGTNIVIEERDLTTEVLKEKFSSFSFFTIVTAGLLDGINPCAFTTIIFFISFLGFAGYQLRQIRWIGSFFIVSVFMTYIAIGFGLSRFLHTLAIFPLLSKTLIWLIALITASLSFFSFRDFWIYHKTGKTCDWSLQLPRGIKHRIHCVIGEGYRNTYGTSLKRPLSKLVGTAFVTGFLVSSLESICTGQVYVPTLVYMTRLQETALQAWGYLLLYNVAFILPLAAVFLLSLFGVTSQQFGQWAERNLGTVKLGTAILFLILTIVLINWKGR